MLACNLCSGIIEPIIGVIGLCVSCSIAHFINFIRRKPHNCKCDCYEE